MIQSDNNCPYAYPIVERLPEPKPVCTWPGRPGVLTLSKGWVARNADGRVWFYNKKPYAVENIGQWDLVIAGGGMARQLGHGLFTDLPVFNHDLPWTEHIVEVGGDCEQESKPPMCAVVDGIQVEPILSIDADLKDGWVAEDQSGELYWYYAKPNRCKYEWIPTEEFGNYAPLRDSEVIFPSSLPWDQRIVRIVGNQIVRDE